VSLAEGATNGTLHLTVNGNAQTDIAVPGWSSKADASALNSYALTSSLGFGTAGTDYVPITLNSVTKNVLTAHQSLAGYLPLTGGTMTGTLNSAVYHPIVLRPSSGASFIQWLTSNSVNAFEVGVSFGGTYPIWLVWDATAAVSALTIKNGKVGIKTDAPAYDLDVNGSIKADAITLTATTSPNLTLNNVGASESSVYARFQMDSVTKAEFGYYNSSAYFGSNSAHKWLRIYDTGAFEYDGNTIYHSGNCNKSDVAWSASSLTLNGAISGATTISFSNHGVLITEGPSSWSYRTILSTGWDSTVQDYTDIGTAGNNNNTSVIRIIANGNVGLGGQLNPQYPLHVAGLIASTGDQVITSDENKKTHFQDINLSVEQIANAPAVTFDWKAGGHSFGSIAQYWKPLLGEMVLGEEGNYSLAYAQGAFVNAIINARAIVALQDHETEQDKEIRELREALGKANEKIKGLEKRVEQLRMN